MLAGEGLRQRNAWLPALWPGHWQGHPGHAPYMAAPPSFPCHLPAAALESLWFRCAQGHVGPAVSYPSSSAPTPILNSGPPQRPHVGYPRWGPPCCHRLRQVQSGWPGTRVGMMGTAGGPSLEKGTRPGMESRPVPCQGPAPEWPRHVCASALSL